MKAFIFLFWITVCASVVAIGMTLGRIDRMNACAQVVCK